MEKDERAPIDELDLTQEYRLIIVNGGKIKKDNEQYYPSPELMNRLKGAAFEYRHLPEKTLVIVSGGYLFDDYVTVSCIMKRYLMEEMWIHPIYIIEEPLSLNPVESVYFVRDMMTALKNKGLQFEKTMVIGNDYQLRRLDYLYKRGLPDISVHLISVPTPMHPEGRLEQRERKIMDDIEAEFKNYEDWPLSKIELVKRGSMVATESAQEAYELLEQAVCYHRLHVVRDLARIVTPSREMIRRHRVNNELEGRILKVLTSSYFRKNPK